MDKPNKIFTEESCLSLKQIMDYIHNRLSGKEKNRIERHLIDCDLCQEAVEGYAHAGDESNVVAINEGIKGTIGNNETVTFDWRRIAAIVTSIFILGGGMFYVSDYLKSVNEVAVNNVNSSTPSVQEKENVLKNIQTDSVVAIEPNTKIESRDLKRKAESNLDGFITIPEEEEREISDEAKDKTTTVLEDTISSILPAPVSKNVTAAKPMQEVSESKLYETELNKVPAPSVMKADKEVKRKSIASSRHKKSEYYSEKSMAPSTSAGITMDVNADSVQTSNSLAVENYKEGLSQYQKGEYQKAIDYFDKVEKGTKEFEDARWYKALSYAKLKNASVAKTLFEEIVKENGPYKKEAEGELMQLK